MRKQTETKHLYIPGGRIKAAGNVFQYNLTDHLGNVRITFQDNGSGTAEIIQTDNYYPFGLRMSGQHYENTDLLNKYLYNGKELQDQNEFYDYGFRQMDPALGRWFVIDAMAEKYLSTSPYAYVRNNPISKIDILGLEEGDYSIADIINTLWSNTGDNGVGTWSSGGGFSYYGSPSGAQGAGVSFPSISLGSGSTGGTRVKQFDNYASSGAGLFFRKFLAGLLGGTYYDNSNRIVYNQNPATTTDTWNWDNNVTNSYSGLGTGNDYDIFAANRNSGGGGRGPGDPPDGDEPEEQGDTGKDEHSWLWRAAEDADDLARNWGPDAAMFLLDINPIYVNINTLSMWFTGEDFNGNVSNDFYSRYANPAIQSALSTYKCTKLDFKEFYIKYIIGKGFEPQNPNN